MFFSEDGVGALENAAPSESFPFPARFSLAAQLFMGKS
jgi:hypothetical protein